LGRGVRFDHRAHLRLAELKGQSIDCHAGVIEGSQSQQQFPPMAVCLQCHQTDFDQANCVPCHRQEQLTRLLPRTFMRHQGAWHRRHGLAAKGRQRICNQCHMESQCADCHEQNQSLPLEVRAPDAVEQEQVHRADYLTRHPLEARSRSTQCLKCHSPASCDGCHLRRGVSGANLNATNPHPIGWVGSDHAASEFHGRAARRGLATCAACHDQGPATNCIRCHRVGGHGGNPHPRGWNSTRSNSATICRYCHGS
jgi:hypothetical protein